ncbi:MAG: sulfotransferase family 2 domain-containing protein [Bacteroidales bacterium]
MKIDIIFIHIPKTGGTTINSAMQEAAWQTKPDFNYRHIEPESKKSNAGDIFTPENFFRYRDYRIFMMLRDPVDRLISEYHFIKERKEFVDLLRVQPRDFEDYIQSKQTRNGMVNFLKGRRMYDLIQPSRRDMEDVLAAIEKIPVHVGIFEEYEKSLQYYSDVTGIKWKSNIEVKRMTFIRPQVSEISDRIRNMILETNSLDVELYQRCLEKFRIINSKTIAPKFQFSKDKYNHVIPYVNKWCFFEFCMENKKYIRANFDYFKELTFYLLKDRNIKEGRLFAESWNKSFVRSVESQFMATDFSNAILSAVDDKLEPLEQTARLANALDHFFEVNKKTANEFYLPMKFNKDQIVVTKTGFFNRLFGG